jgi:hypothetical protein
MKMVGHQTISQDTRFGLKEKGHFIEEVLVISIREKDQPLIYTPIVDVVIILFYQWRGSRRHENILQ